LRDLVIADPGLPHPYPTEPYWLSIPHHLATVQSPSLPEIVDVVVIGSGISGTSIAFHALEDDPNLQVAVVEARTLCSGATGRNGGHVITYEAISYASLKRSVGTELAFKILNFTFTNVDMVAEAAQRYACEESQYRPVERVRGFGDEDSLVAAKGSVAEYEADFPEESG
jgi:glycine/D-amino acid oxidase-like deaminating enzyme